MFRSIFLRKVCRAKKGKPVLNIGREVIKMNDSKTVLQFKCSTGTVSPVEWNLEGDTIFRSLFVEQLLDIPTMICGTAVLGPHCT